MKFALIVIIAMLASALAAGALLSDPGYVAISIRGHLFEMSAAIPVGLRFSKLEHR